MINTQVYIKTKQYTVLKCANSSLLTIVHNKSKAKRPLNEELSAVFECEMAESNRFYSESAKNNYLDAICRDWCFFDLSFQNTEIFDDEEILYKNSAVSSY